MSKTKNTLKRKTTPFEILYRVVAAAMAIAVFPVAYFSKLFIIVFDLNSVSSLVSVLQQLLSGGEENATSGTNTFFNNLNNAIAGETYIEKSVAELPEFFEYLSSYTGGSAFDMKSFLSNEYFRPLIVAGVFFIVALVIALVIFFFAAFSNKIKVVTGLSIGGIVSLIVTKIAFSAFANPIINDEITLSKLFTSDSGILGALLDFINVSVIDLRGAYTYVLFLFIALLCWSVAVLLVNGDEHKKDKSVKKEKKQDA